MRLIRAWMIVVKSALRYPWWRECDNLCAWVYPYGYCARVWMSYTRP